MLLATVQSSTATTAMWINLGYAGFGVLMVALGLPMFLEKVKPNRVYGFRTRKTLSDPKIWYQANKAAGWDMIIAGIVIMAAAGVIFAMGRKWSTNINFVSLVNLGVTCVALAVMVIHSFVVLKRIS